MPGASPVQRQIVDILELLQTCVAGDGKARRAFQEAYGKDIYNFPVKICGLSSEQAGDFYIYAFENDRIFNRLRTFVGRNNIQFRTFLSYYVLRDLFCEWRRTRKEIETVSLHVPVGTQGDREKVLEDFLPSVAAAEARDITVEEQGFTIEFWRSLSLKERLTLKLLFLLENDLNPTEIRLLAEISRRSLHETSTLLAGVQKKLRRKDAKLSQLRDDLDSVWGWIILRQKELHDIKKKIHLAVTNREAAHQAKLLAQKKKLECSLVKRYRQRTKIIEAIRTYQTTTAYKDIARLLNCTVGTVCSRIFRLRERLMRECRGKSTGEEHIL